MRRWLWFGVPLASLCVLLAVGIESLSRTSRALSRLSRADETRLALDDLVNSLEQAESGERAYLITSDPHFLEAYARASTSWHGKLDRLRVVTDSSQRADVEAIETLVSRALDAMSRTLADATAGVSALGADIRRASALIGDVRRVGFRVQDHAEEMARSRVATATSREHWQLAAFVGVVFSFVFGSAWIAVQRRRDDKRRRLAEERAALLDVTDQFIAVLGHDLRNPLGAAHMAAKLLAARELPAPESMLVQRIGNSTQRMLRMIEDLLDLARSRLGPGIPVVRTPSDVRDIVSNVVDEMRTRYPNARVLYDWRGDAKGSWDHDRMSQVVSNLVGNAIEHGDRRRPVHVHVERYGDGVELSVHNFGDPIPAEALPTLFASYKRPSSAARRGLGLGLFIADQIVRAHDGTLHVTSTEAEGTTFTATFERAE